MIYILAIIFGLCAGSFINALVWRVHEQSRNMAAHRDKYLSVLRGRSLCPHCRHTLAWYDLVPLLSWLALKGRCRYCARPISLQYPLVELLTAALFAISAIQWPQPLSGQLWFGLAVWFVILTGLIALLVYDLKWMLLPNRIVYPLLGIAAADVLIRALVFAEGIASVAQAFWGLLTIGGLFYLLFQVSKGKWIGGGDVKLGALLGLLAGGPLSSLLLLFLASLSGSIISLPLLLTGKLSRSTLIPFGPFLIAAGIVTKLFGDGILRWYETVFFIS